MVARIATTRTNNVEFYEYNDQPRADWPQWLQDRFTGKEVLSRPGDVAVASYETPTGEPSWWRWFTPEEFNSRFTY
jgi:hypothetical protein